MNAIIDHLKNLCFLCSKLKCGKKCKRKVDKDSYQTEDKKIHLLEMKVFYNFFNFSGRPALKPLSFKMDSSTTSKGFMSPLSPTDLSMRPATMFVDSSPQKLEIEIKKELAYNLSPVGSPGDLDIKADVGSPMQVLGQIYFTFCIQFYPYFLFMNNFSTKWSLEHYILVSQIYTSLNICSSFW